MDWRDAPIIEKLDSWRDAPLVENPPPKGPWEKYQKLSKPKPWEKYAAQKASLTTTQPASNEAPNPDAQTGDYLVPPPLESTETPKSTPESNDLVRGLRIGAQGVGEGVAGLVGAPVDITSMALNAGSYILEKGVNVLPGVEGVQLPKFNSSVGGSENLSTGAGDIIRALGGEDAIIPKSEMTSSERIALLTNQLATEGLVGGGVLSKAAHADKMSKLNVAPDILTAPYKTSGSTARVVAGDTAAGAGSGFALGEYREKVPEPVLAP